MEDRSKVKSKGQSKGLGGAGFKTATMSNVRVSAGVKVRVRAKGWSEASGRSGRSGADWLQLKAEGGRLAED